MSIELYQAVLYVNVEQVKDLLSQGADPNNNFQRSKFPLLAVTPSYGDTDSKREQDKLEITKLLVDAGADINHVDRSSYSTPLLHSIASNLPTIAQFLIEKGAIFNHSNIIDAFYEDFEEQYEYDFEHLFEEECPTRTAMRYFQKLCMTF